MPLIPKPRTSIRQWASSISLTSSQQTTTPVINQPYSPYDHHSSRLTRRFPAKFLNKSISHVSPFRTKCQPHHSPLQPCILHNKLLHGKCSLMFLIIIGLLNCQVRQPRWFNNKDCAITYRVSREECTRLRENVL
jgi:hypothetical protein